LQHNVFVICDKTDKDMLCILFLCSLSFLLRFCISVIYMFISDYTGCNRITSLFFSFRLCHAEQSGGLFYRLWRSEAFFFFVLRAKHGTFFRELLSLRWSGLFFDFFLVRAYCIFSDFITSH